MNEIYHIYDKAFKRILTLSEKTVINLINGLFDTDYPTDSKITYNWTEHENKNLKGKRKHCEKKNNQRYSLV